MDVEELTEEAKLCTRAQFERGHPYLFLLFYEEKDEISPVHFFTEAVPDDWVWPPSTAVKGLGGVLRVLPIVKRADNPFKDRVSVGRARNCDVVLRHASVSKLHAHVRQEPDGGWVVVDADSQNGTAVGNRTVTDEPVALASGDIVTFGAVRVRVVDGGELYDVLGRLAQAVPKT